MRRSFFRVLTLASLVHLGCSSDDPVVDRRGGELPPDGSAGKASGGSGGEGGGGGGDAIPFCAALTVMRAKCQRCHGEPLQNGAPVPFLTYEDTQAPYGTSEFTYAEAMVSVVEKDIMPYVTLNDSENPPEPPVEPLTADEKATLLGWLNQGAKPEGGTTCP